MNGLPYYKAYPRDFIEGTVGMSFEMKAAYRLVLDLIYMQAGKLPDDAGYISGLLGCSTRKWNALRRSLLEAGKLYAKDGFIGNFRADNQLESSRKLQEKNAENGRQSSKNNSLPKSIDKLTRGIDTEPEPEPEKTERKEGGASAGDDLVFEGRVIRLKAKDFNRWKTAYNAIPDFMSALAVADDYYSENPPPQGKWFFPVSRWLEKEHRKAEDATKRYDPKTDPAMRGVDCSPLTPEQRAYALANGLS